MLKNKYFLITALYFSQFIPLSFFLEALPPYLRMQGSSYGLIGVLHLAFLPWMLKFLWAPAIDRYSPSRRSHYRGWIFIMQFLCTLTLILISGFDVSSIYIILGLILLLSLFSSTQDIASDALAVNILKRSERGVANGIQNAAHILGSMLGGGLMLYMLGASGWNTAIIVLAAVMALPFIPLYFSRENPESREENTRTGYFTPLVSFFKAPGNKIWIIFLVTAPLGMGMSDFIMKPYMIDKGLSLESVAAVRSLYGLSAGFIGAITGGFLIKYLGRYRTMSILVFCTAYSILFFMIPVYIESSFTVFIIITMITKFIGGMFTTALFTLIMDKSRKGTAGTDFSMQIALLTFSSHMLSSFFGGIILSAGGYNLLFAASAVFALIPMYLLFYKPVAYRIQAA
jgi:predicted MFS family arabinose efflux permease